MKFIIDYYCMHPIYIMLHSNIENKFVVIKKNL